ncbi:MAG: metallophosphoesterase family protein [Planctomycetaceae bacterium]|nr:metallophosphoesterase [Planctomycetaceae bacterium]
MLAIISDIHSNIEALTAVLRDIESRGVKRIVCLGDVVGYGPNPCEALDLIMRHCEVTLMGNHDFAALYEPNNFNMGAEAACFWTRRKLEKEPDLEKRGARWDYLGALPVKHVISGEALGLPGVTDVAFTHGSPRRPINEYIFPDDVYNCPGKFRGLFERFNHLCFVGHTHVPGVFLETPDFYSPDELDDGVFEVSFRKAMVNVGSVGQPRDRDNRASYATLEPNGATALVRFVRVPYNVDATMAKVRATPELDDYLGSRLREGR